MNPPKNRFAFLLLMPALVLAACAPDAAADTNSTAVAQTVAAQETQRAAVTVTAPPPTATAPAAAATITPTVAKPPTARPGGGTSACARASWQGDTPPDGKIMKPGEEFWKTWTIQNTSTCTWTTSYQIIYWDGDRLAKGRECANKPVVAALRRLAKDRFPPFHYVWRQVLAGVQAHDSHRPGEGRVDVCSPGEFVGLRLEVVSPRTWQKVEVDAGGVYTCTGVSRYPEIQLDPVDAARLLSAPTSKCETVIVVPL